MPLMCAGGDEPDPMALCVDPVVRARQPHSVFSQNQRAAHTPLCENGSAKVCHGSGGIVLLRAE